MKKTIAIILISLCFGYGGYWVNQGKWGEIYAKTAIDNKQIVFSVQIYLPRWQWWIKSSRKVSIYIANPIATITDNELIWEESI